MLEHSFSAEIGTFARYRTIPDFIEKRKMAHPKRFELLTPRFVVWCSIQLSYGCVCDGHFRLRGDPLKGAAEDCKRFYRKKCHSSVIYFINH